MSTMSEATDIGGQDTDRMECPFCAERIAKRAKKCRYCHETVDITLRMAEEAVRAKSLSGNIYVNSTATANISGPYRPAKSRGVAIVLALFLGGLGAHKFYLGQTGWGVIYLLFCWSLIPMVVALFEALGLLLMGNETFHRRFG